MRALPLVALVLALAACDSGASGPPLPEGFGRFEAEVSGALTRSLAGTASFYEIPSPTGERVGLSLTLADPRGPRRALSFTDYGGAFADAGTYRFDANRVESGISLLYVDDASAPAGPSAFYSAESGTVQITRSDGERIEGSFEARLAPPRATGGAAEATVTGTFEAVPLRVPSR